MAHRRRHRKSFPGVPGDVVVLSSDHQNQQEPYELLVGHLSLRCLRVLPLLTGVARIQLKEEP